MDPFDLVGDVLDGEFRVDEVVGEGALSVVYRAENVTMGVPACVKCLNLPTTLDPGFAQSVVTSFVEGCKLHYRLARGHLAIAQTFTTGTTVAPRTGAQIHYIVREWFEGEAFAQNLRRRRAEGEHGRTLAEVRVLFEPVASALTYAHSQDAEHLALTPSNMFLATSSSGESTLKLLDFGVGRAVGEAVSTRSPLATKAPRIKLLLPSYAAPEQLDTTLGPTGPWTDVYAFALVLLEALSDRPVMGEKDASALIARALSTSTRPTPREHGVLLPAHVEQAFVRALALEPESRPSSLAEFWDEVSRKERSERRRLPAHLRRLRRSRRPGRPVSLRPPPPAFDHEAPTAKVRSVAAMLTAPAARASARPPPLTKRPPPPVPVVATKRPPAPVIAAPPLPRIAPVVHEEPKVVIDAPLLAPLEPALPPPPPPSPPVPVESNSPVAADELPIISPFDRPRRTIDRRVVALAAASGVIVLALAVGAFALARRHTSEGAPVGSTGPATSAIASVEPVPFVVPPVVTSASSDSSPAPPATAQTAKPKPGRFNRRQAVSAVQEATADLSSCRRKGSKVWGKGQAGVVFYNDGSVRQVLMSAPFNGPEGDCVRDKITQAHIDPFVGIIGPTYVYFVIPF